MPKGNQSLAQTRPLLGGESPTLHQRENEGGEWGRKRGVEIQRETYRERRTHRERERERETEREKQREREKSGPTKGICRSPDIKTSNHNDRY